MKKRVTLIALLLTMASSNIAFADSGVVNASALNIRQNPTLSSRVISSIPRNTKINTLGKSGSFYKVTYQGKTGYAYSSYIKIAKAVSTSPVVIVTGVGNITAWGLNVRKAPTNGNNVIGKLNPTKSINLYGIQNNYYKIKYGSGWGYIAKSYVKSGATKTTLTQSSSKTSKINTLISNANKLLGIDYKWGGALPSTGFDCSGLSQYLYKTVGVTLPRTTYEQITKGTPVNINNLQKGDLVFFATDSSSRYSPSHMGIYVGNNKFVESPKTGDVVKIISLDGYFRSVFITGRRIF
ncbi:C40 family peptidase [Clostridium psychrophilum]|uniref:C40 family peptidase n=1 Tax=Clostridium psychrophilum TaxID=132926 RepID=UPI001C0CBEE7|nr:NlpC/P60 family protein [Clostridium psychrophilum]MBU3181768.1 C40 family peptidase [Clostridium psychrophilum]